MIWTPFENTGILLFKKFVSTQLHQCVYKSDCSIFLGPIHLVRILLCFTSTQLSRVLLSHQLTCTTDQDRHRGIRLYSVINRFE